MFEKIKENLKEIEDLKHQLGTAKSEIETLKGLQECLHRELMDAIAAKKSAEESSASMKDLIRAMGAKLDESGIVEGYIKRIEQAPAVTSYSPDGIIITVQVNRPTHPRCVWGNQYLEAMDDPTHKDYPKLKPHLDKYRREINEFNAFHVGTVFLKMPALEKEL